MICYVGLKVGIHGLDDRTAGVIRGRVEDILRQALDPAYNSDITVEVDEFAGTEEP